MVLRQHGPEVYDQWVSHEIPFNDPQIVEAMQTVLDLWSEDNVFASGGNIAATDFEDNAQPLVDGQCYMHRQANFFGGFFPEGTAFADGSEEAIDVFYFPDINGDQPGAGRRQLRRGVRRGAGHDGRPRLHGDAGVRQAPPGGADRASSTAACRASCRPPRARTRRCTSRSSRGSSRS